MNIPLTLALELRLVSTRLTGLEWLGIAVIGVAILGVLYLAVFVLPQMVSLERKSAARIIELLESIDRRLSDQNRP